MTPQAGGALAQILVTVHQVVNGGHVGILPALGFSFWPWARPKVWSPRPRALLYPAPREHDERERRDDRRIRERVSDARIDRGGAQKARLADDDGRLIDRS